MLDIRNETDSRYERWLCLSLSSNGVLFIIPSFTSDNNHSQTVLVLVYNYVTAVKCSRNCILHHMSHVSGQKRECSNAPFS